MAPPGALDPVDAFDVTFTDRFAAAAAMAPTEAPPATETTGAAELTTGLDADSGAFDIAFTAPDVAALAASPESAPSSTTSSVVEVDFSEFADVFGATVESLRAEAAPLPVDEEEVLLAGASVDAQALVDVDAGGNVTLPPVAAATTLPMFSPFVADDWEAVEPPLRDKPAPPKAPPLAASPSREETWRVLGPGDVATFDEPAAPRTSTGGSMPGLAPLVAGRGLLVDRDGDAVPPPPSDKPQDGR